MPVFDSTYFALTRVREMGPEAADWAATDTNWDIISRIAKLLENHSHSGNVSLAYPGDTGDPENPVLPDLSSIDTDGFLQPGDSLSVRLSYVDANGLETQATQETVIDLPGASPRPLTPTEEDITPTVGAIPGGSYFYTITKVKGSGESALSDLLPVSVPFDQTYSVTVGFEPINTYANLVIIGDTTSGSSNIKNIPNTSAISPGMAVSGSGVPAGSIVNAIVSGTEITISGKATTTASTVALTFNDGTEALNIYRTTGLDQGFQKITQITDTSKVSFEDKNEILPENVNVQPPTSSTFDATRQVVIDWSAYSHPADAKKLRVYVTQEVGLWGTSHLLKEVDLSGTPDTETSYLGNEVLQQGCPKNDTQIPSSPQQINLSTDAAGGLLLSDDSDYQGFAALNFKLGTSPTITKQNGMIWYDSGTKQIIGRLNGTDVVIGTVTGAYSHPTESSGGHIAANIPFKASSGISTKDVMDFIADSSGARKQVQSNVRVIGTTDGPTTSSTTATVIPEMSLTVTPDFNNQWFRIDFGGHFQMSSALSNLTVVLEIDSVQIESTIRTTTSVTTNANISPQITYTKQLATGSHTIKILWWVDLGAAKAVGTRRNLSSTGVF